MDYSIFYAKPSKAPTKVEDYSHYNDPIDPSDGQPHGNGREAGNASPEVQRQVIDAIISQAQERGLSTEDQANLLAMARVESGFNPDAAPGSSSASGVGQIINKTGKSYGLDDSNRFNITDNVNAMIGCYLEAKDVAAKKGHADDIAWIYKYYHDGPKEEHGGLAIGRSRVAPLVDGYEDALLKEQNEQALRLRTRWKHLFEFKDAIAAAKQYQRRYDPLALDLDGDGIETRALTVSDSSVYFDFNGDGAKTNTGWISSDDGYLVLDRNNNGTIDNASELFSDYTPLPAGGTAANGFVALTQEDTDKDGVVNNLDTNWNNLKIWKDINQDGISQNDELLTMDQAGIAGLNVAKTSTNQTLANGNSIKGTGTYIKADGTTGQMADVYFAIDTTNQQFTDTIPIVPEVEALPYMPGSGLVRDLHQAASMSPQLANLLTQYSQATTRQEQMALIDQLLYAWADTSGMAATMDERDPVRFRIQYNAFGSVARYNNYVAGGGGTNQYIPDEENPQLTESYRQLIAQKRVSRVRS